MTLAAFTWTDRARPIVELGIGDTRIPAGQATWDHARWDTAGDMWAGTEPVWHDITCDTHQFRCLYGRVRVTDRFTVGEATVSVDNASGWADPNVVGDTNVLTVRPGRPIRMGVIHQDFGVRWLFRGFVDSVLPTYDPVDPDRVELSCIDALGEVNRAKFVPQLFTGAGETVRYRIHRILDLTKWPTEKRDVDFTSDTLIGDDLSGQAADLLGRAADSNGGSVFGDMEGRVAYRSRDWQTFQPGTPPDGTIGNVEDGSPNRVTFDPFNYLEDGAQVVWGATVPADVCPTRWERPFARADIATRIIVGRESDPASLVQLDDLEGQLLYGIEPFQRTDLLTQHDDTLAMLARRFLNARHHTTAPRVRSVSLSAATADNALDLMSTVDVYKPSRYRCRLQYDRGMVFDDEYFATAVAHDVTPSAWTLELNLDSAAPFAVVGERWDSGHWDSTVWAADPVADLVAEARELIGELTS
jgi:hypothetical protein